MTQHAKEFALKLIKEKEIEKGEGYERITVRVDKKQWAMLVILTQYFNIKTSNLFTDILSKEIADMVKSLNKDDLEEFRNKIKVNHSSSGAKSLLIQDGILEVKPIVFKLDDL